MEDRLNEINVVYATDNNYSMLAGISALSLCKHNSDVNINIYFLCNDVSDDNLEKLKVIAKDDKNVFVTCIDLKTAFDNSLNMKNYAGGGYTAYGRIFIRRLLPKLHGRILYLDCDTLVNSSIKDLFSGDMNGKPIAMGYDCIRKEYVRKIQKLNGDYFNSGVMLLDLDVWESLDCESRMLPLLKDNSISDKYMLADQDLLNAVFQKDIKPFGFEYNFLSQYFMYNKSSEIKFVFGINYHDKCLKQAFSFNDIKIFHFCGNTFIRPWFKNSLHPAKKLYDSFYYDSPWKDIPQKMFKMKVEYKLQYLFFKYLPKPIFLFLSLLMQRLFMLKEYHV